MKSKLLTSTLFFVAAISGFGQEQEADPIKIKSEPAKTIQKQNVPEKTTPSDDNSAKAVSTAATVNPYQRPNAERRFRNYANSVVGPAALIQYVSAAGLLTWRNSPKEWGSKWNGYGRRLTNSFGKSLVKNTTIYGLDEALKVDSNFYRSKDRSVAARMRNSLFSAVTARNKKGERVIGIPRITGSFVSEVTSSTLWYPQRYDHVHGLKGGVISLGISVGVNLFREFVWKK